MGVSDPWAVQDGLVIVLVRLFFRLAVWVRFFWPSWAPLGVALGRFWSRFGLSWALLGSFWGAPGAVWVLLRAYLLLSVVVLAALDACMLWDDPCSLFTGPAVCALRD